MTAHLPDAERTELVEDLNYLNLTELREVCATHGIPYRIRVEQPDGGVRRTAQNDRKGVVLDRLRRFLETGERVPATVLSIDVAGPSPPAAGPTAEDRVHYRWYDRSRPEVLNLLRSLTGGEFRDGARARTLLMAHWTEGRAPTFAAFAAEWLAAERRGDSLVAAEYAYLTDLQAGSTDRDWKALRARRAQRALSRLRDLPAAGREASGSGAP